MTTKQSPIPYLSLKAVTAQHLDEIQAAVARVVERGWYLQGEEVAQFEQEYADYIGTRHCIGCANGLDALTLIFRAYKELGRLQEGDEVIVPANTYIASILSISENGLKPVLVEPREDTLQIDDRLIEAAITPRTRAILIVHLYGRNAFTPAIADICHRHNLLLVEDNAQAQGCDNSKFEIQNSKLGYRDDFNATVQPPVGTLGSSVRESRINPTDKEIIKFKVQSSKFKGPAPAGRRTGSLGHAAAHSFYPGKNLGALGDAGAVTTDNDELATVVRALANYGSSKKYVFDYRGRNSRLDEVQAAVLRIKLKYLDADNARRKAIAHQYYAHIANPLITLPGRDEWLATQANKDKDNTSGEDCVYHIFPILCPRRDDLQPFLADRGIGTMIHYPIPPHHQACYTEWSHLSLPITERIHRQELSVPCNQTMTDDDVERVIDALNSFS